MMLSLDDVEFWAEVPDDVLPEIRLWADVMYVGLYDAACYLGCSLGKVKPVSGDDRKARSQAWWWIFDDGRTDAGSFIWCCRLFDFDPEQTRNRLMNRWEDIVKGQLKFSNKKTKNYNNNEDF